MIRHFEERMPCWNTFTRHLVTRSDQRNVGSFRRLISKRRNSRDAQLSAISAGRKVP